MVRVAIRTIDRNTMRLPHTKESKDQNSGVTSSNRPSLSRRIPSEPKTKLSQPSSGVPSKPKVHQGLQAIGGNGHWAKAHSYPALDTLDVQHWIDNSSADMHPTDFSFRAISNASECNVLVTASSSPKQSTTMDKPNPGLPAQKRSLFTDLDSMGVPSLGYLPNIGDDHEHVASSHPHSYPLDPQLLDADTSPEAKSAMDIPGTIDNFNYGISPIAGREAASTSLPQFFPMGGFEDATSHNSWIQEEPYHIQHSGTSTIATISGHALKSPVAVFPMERTASSFSHESFLLDRNAPSGPLDIHGFPGSFHFDDNAFAMTPSSSASAGIHSSLHTAQLNHHSTVGSFIGCQQVPVSGVNPLPLDPGHNLSLQSYVNGGNQDNRRMSESSGQTNPRHHMYYEIDKPKGELYHCPYNVGDKACGHPPEAQKCNFHKHLDSHFKPWRCKQKQCETTPFSSSACLLRHEREAHGMHGHGRNPYRCEFEGCHRYNDGFPRRWNARDHMKRMHNYEPTSPVGSQSPTLSSVSTRSLEKDGIATKKRRTSSVSQAQAMKRTKSSDVKPVANVPTGPSQEELLLEQRQKLQKEWESLHATTTQCVLDLSSDDLESHDQIRNNLDVLHKIGEKLETLSSAIPLVSCQA